MGEKKGKKELTAEEKEKAERTALIKRILEKEAPTVGMPEEPAAGERKIFTKEYREFKEEVARGKIFNPYEKLAKFCYKLGKITADPKTRESLQQAITFTGLKVTPDEVMSFTIWSIILLFIAVIPILFVPIEGIIKMMVFVMPVGVGYLVYTYPGSTANIMRIKAGRDLVIAVLYMIVYMKTAANLEGAVRFAATNVYGKLADDLKEVLWKVEVGIYTTVEEALIEYVMTWKAYNQEFIDAVHLIRESMLEMVPASRDVLLDKAIDIVLIGTDERMKKYARELEMPITILHGLGVMLPVMGMIVFPLVSIFMGEAVAGLPIYLFLGYDVIIPLFLFFFMKRVLDKRPSTSTQVDISEHPDFVPMKYMKIGKSRVLVWPIAAIISFVVMLPALSFMIQTALFTKLAECAPITSASSCSALSYCSWSAMTSKCSSTALGMPLSFLFVFGIAVGLMVYYYGTSFQKIHLRDNVVNIEGEFEEALFALGNRLAGGTPIELAVAQAEEDTKSLGISELFRTSLKNIRQMGMTFEQSLFDEQYGALRYYPSRMIRTIMHSVVETVKKGTKAASITMLTISRYLRNIHTTQERINDLLTSILSSMRFQAYILVPAISGVIVAVADLIMRMLAQLSTAFATITPAGGGTTGEFAAVNPAEMLFGLKSATPPEILQVIVGIYVVEILVILGIFINRIEVGEDQIKQNDTVWHLVLFGVIIYFVILMMVKAMFGPVISAAAVL